MSETGKGKLFRTIGAWAKNSSTNLRESAGSPANTPPTSPGVSLSDDAGRRSPLIVSADRSKQVISPTPLANGEKPAAGPVSSLNYSNSPSNPSPPTIRRTPSTSAGSVLGTTPTSSSPSSLDASSPGSPSSNPLSASPTELSLDSPRADDSNFSESSAKILNFVVGAKIKSAPEGARTGHTGVLFEDSMYVFGGFGADGTTVTSDFIAFSFGNRSWSNVSATPSPAESIPPPARAHQAAVVFETQMIVFGGTDGTSVKNNLYTYSFDTQMWAELTPTDAVIPPARKQHTMVAGTSSIYVFGGVGDNGEPLSDLFQFNLETKAWSQVTATGTIPSPRFSHGAAIYKEIMWVFGGSNKSSTLDDLYSFNTATNTWATVTGEGTPPSRSGHAMVPFQDSIYVVGGLTGSDIIDIYEFDPEHPQWFKIQTTLPGVTRQGHSAVLHNESIFLFGGIPASSGEVAGSLDYLCLGKDDFEEDLLQEAAQDEELLRLQSLPRSVWEATLLKKHAEILELRERARPVTQLTTYGRRTDAAITENRIHLNHQVVLQLAMEYLASLGYWRTVRAIQEEIYLIDLDHHSNGEEPACISLLRLVAPQVKPKQLFEQELVFNNVKPEEGDAEVQSVDHIPGRIDADAEDVNIWDEPGDSRKYISFHKEEGGKKGIRAASLNKLIQYLTSEKDKAHDLNMQNFFYTYHSFTTPEQLLKKLIQRYTVPIPKGVVVDDKYRADFIEPVQTRVCNLLKFWVTKCDWDFLGPNSEKLLTNLNAFIDGPLSRDGNLNQVKQLRNCITKTMKKKTGEEEVKPYAHGTNPPEPKVPKNIFSSSLSLKDIDELEIARQLTLIDFNIFALVTPIEFLNREWEDTSSKRAPHLAELLNRADDIRRWVVYNIVNGENKKARGRMIEKYIKTAEHLRNLKNFQTMFAVVAGLSSPFVSRLSQSWAEVPPRTKEIFQELLVLTNRDGNFKHYREALHALRSGSQPTVPLLYVDTSHHLREVAPRIIFMSAFGLEVAQLYYGNPPSVKKQAKN